MLIMRVYLWCGCACDSFIGDSGDRGKACVPDLVRDCSLHYVLPRTSLTPLLVRGVLSVHHVAYAYAVWKFAFHFLSRETAEVQQITSELSAATGQASKGIRALVCKEPACPIWVAGILFDYCNCSMRDSKDWCYCTRGIQATRARQGDLGGVTRAWQWLSFSRMHTLCLRTNRRPI